jgi:hypothetical protein
VRAKRRRNGRCRIGRGGWRDAWVSSPVVIDPYTNLRHGCFAARAQASASPRHIPAPLWRTGGEPPNFQLAASTRMRCPLWRNGCQRQPNFAMDSDASTRRRSLRFALNPVQSFLVADTPRVYALTGSFLVAGRDGSATLRPAPTCRLLAWLFFFVAHVQRGTPPRASPLRLDGHTPLTRTACARQANFASYAGKVSSTRRGRRPSLRGRLRRFPPRTLFLWLRENAYRSMHQKGLGGGRGRRGR